MLLFSMRIILIVFYTNCFNCVSSINHDNHDTVLIQKNDVSLCNINAVIKNVESFPSFSAVSCLASAPRRHGISHADKDCVNYPRGLP